ncbi:MAG: alpha/beta fold hydrolase [Chloroflexota bacterium]
MPYLDHDGLTFHYRDIGHGLPVVFQHGLGSDVSQPLSLFAPPPGVRLISFDCRAHGKTHPVGNSEGIGIGPFADDLRAVLDTLLVDQAVVSGISMGAAVALNFAIRYPDRTRGLILSRPAWLDRPFPPHLQIYAEVARLIRAHGGSAGREIFLQSSHYAAALQASPTTAASLLSQFDAPGVEEVVVRLERIPRDAPGRSRDAWHMLTVPTLVLANRQDPIHPFEYGVILAREIPAAEFKELTPKAVDERRHIEDTQSSIEDFVRRQFLHGGG